MEVTPLHIKIENPLKDMIPGGFPWSKERLEEYAKQLNSPDNPGFIYTYGERLRNWNDEVDQVQYIIKKIKDNEFDPSRSAFFMPTASGPCRFGHYQQAQEIILKNLGYADVPLVSPTAKTAYGDMMGLKLGFRRLAWQGVVAADFLTKLTHLKRPYEKNKGDTDQLYNYYMQELIKTIEGKNGKLPGLMKQMNKDFALISTNGFHPKPVIGMVGEIFLRLNPHCNTHIVRKVEALGGEARVVPIFEWGFYTNLGYMYESYMRRRPDYFALAFLRDLVQKWDEHRLAHQIKSFKTKEPSSLKLIKNSSPYLHYSFKGEAVLTIGKAIDFIENGAAGIINIMPFTCMPGTVASALSKRVRKDYGDFPWMDLPIDENEGVNLDTRLEAFMHQAVNARREG